MTDSEEIAATESIMKMVPLQTKIFFIFVLALVIVIILLTLSLNEYLYFLLDRLTNAIEDLRDSFGRCRRRSEDGAMFHHTGKRKDRKRYSSKRFRRRKTKRDVSDSDSEREDEEDEEDDEDSDDEVMMAYWRMVDKEKDSFGEGDFKMETARVALAMVAEAGITLKIQIGLRYDHETGSGSCHVMKVGGLVSRVVKKEPWIGAQFPSSSSPYPLATNPPGIFARMLILTHDGLMLYKVNSKINKIISGLSGEIRFDEYLNFEIPFSKINKVIMLISLYVVPNFKKEDGGKDGGKGCGKGGGKDGGKEVERAKESEEDSKGKSTSKTAVSFISFGVNASSKKALEQWSLMVPHPDEVNNWHELTQQPIF